MSPEIWYWYWRIGVAVNLTVVLSWAWTKARMKQAAGEAIEDKKEFAFIVAVAALFGIVVWPAVLCQFVVWRVSRAADIKAVSVANSLRRSLITHGYRLSESDAAVLYSASTTAIERHPGSMPTPHQVADAMRLLANSGPVAAALRGL